MNAPIVIVLEQRSRWGPELARQLAQEARVRECRSTGDLDVLLASSPAAAAADLVVMDLAAGPGLCLQWLGRRTGRAGPPVVVLGQADSGELEWPIRELGAAAFVAGHTSGHRLAELCRKLLSHPALPAGPVA